MKNWKKTVVDLGDIEVNVKKIILFQSYKPLEIILIKGKCGCISGKYDKKTKTLTVRYVPNPIPIHLRNVGEYSANKNLVVTYYDGTTEVLTVKAIVKNIL